MNDASDCGKVQGDGKGKKEKKGKGIKNQWLLEGFTAADGVLDCSAPLQ